ncbi:DoxX family membrane protein [Sinomicrobium weinanense]|uniref:DoxX family membrane protein n=1 Tax=Sinomicrobium weinanense TaxID=2842200 RepID=A0A926JQJ4_9FLAO|nr:DoxX family membrane protein [Sinomicrobium weinanense]MBC9795613.1 DoxX family membrane protein [Sinomicrobium weinanense]MBU3124634.1 DoxX family membrane protein [Sinomicrobium weinanense]
MPLKIIHIVLRLILGGMLVYGGFAKFSKPVPEPTQIIEQVQKGEDLTSNIDLLKMRNYIFGMKQTGYFWPFLGIVEFLAGILLLSQVFGALGAIVALPVTLNIFLFHFFLKPGDMPGLLQTLGLLAINIWLIAAAYSRWKPLLIDKKIW